MTWLNTHRLTTAIVLVGVFAMAARVPYDADVWWHLAGGRAIWQSGAVPQVDPWSWSSPGRAWVDNGWLWQMLAYGLYATFGVGGLVVLTAAAATLALGVLYAHMQGTPWVRALVVVLVAAAAGPVWSARPQMATFALTAVSAFWLDRYVRGTAGRGVWLLVPLTVLWVNLHAGYVTLFFLLGCVGLGLLVQGAYAQVRTLVLVGVACVAVVPLNPYGVQMLTYPFYNAGQAFARAYIAEWEAPDFHLALLQPFLVYLLILLGALAAARSRATPVTVITLIVFGALALQAQRAIGLFVVVAAPALADALATLTPEVLARPARRPTVPLALMNWVLLIVVVLAALVKVALPMSPRVNAEALVQMGVPRGATAWLAQARPQARLFNSYNWGGYLIWEGRPVFVDGRADLYGDPFLLAYIELAKAQPGWEETFARYGVDTVLIESGGPLARALVRTPGWRLAFSDAISEIWVKQE